MTICFLCKGHKQRKRSKEEQKHMKRKPQKVITIANQKGGSGKTTTALALAQWATSKGYEVLCIDLDNQANLTTALGGKIGALTALSFLMGTTSPSSCIQATSQGISLVAGHNDLATLKTEAGSALRLKRALDAIKANFDLVVIDTPPQVGEAQYNALIASTDLIITLAPNLFDLQGLYNMADTAKAIKRTNTDLEVTGYILTNYNAQSKLGKTLEEEIAKGAEAYGVPNLGTIRRSISIKEAQVLQQSLYEYAPKSKPALDYQAIFERLITQ